MWEREDLGGMCRTVEWLDVGVSTGNAFKQNGWKVGAARKGNLLLREERDADVETSYVSDGMKLRNYQ